MSCLSSFKKCCLLCFILFLCGFGAFSGPSLGTSPVPTWLVPVTIGGKAPSAKEFSEGYFTAFVDRQINLEKKTTYYRSVRQIVTETGIQNGSEISVSFDPLYEHIDFHSVIIWRQGKAISQLKISDFKIIPVESDRQRFIYNGYYSASLILKDIRKGDRIEYAFSRKGWNPVYQGKYSGVLNFAVSEYVPHMHFAVFAEPSRVLYFKDFNKSPQKKTSKINGLTVYEWDLKDIKAVSYEDFSPSWYEEGAFVQVSEYKSWEEVVNWGLQYYQIPILAGPLKAKIDEWKKTAESRLAYIQLATRFVQDEIRYLGIETGENSHRPHAPSQVFSQRYGDCKDKAFLLCAILDANDIEADPVLVNTYRKSHVSDCLPTPNDFNHVVVRVKTDEKSYNFVDATYALQGGAGSTLFFPAYGKGLLLRKGFSSLIDIPTQSPGAIEVTEDIILPDKQTRSDTARLMVKTVYFTGEADNMRSTFQQGNLSEIEKDYLDYYKGVFKKLQVEVVDTLEYYDQREGNNFSLVERYNLVNPWVYDSTRKAYYFSIFGKMLSDQIINLPNSSRTEPVSLPFPYHMRYKILMHFSGYRNVSTASWEIKRDSYIIRFKSEINETEGGWELAYEYQTLDDHVPLKEVGQFKDDMTKLLDELDYEVRNTGASVSDSANWNPFMIMILFVTFVISFFGFRRLYNYSPGSRFASGTGIPLGGWLIWIGIILVIQPFMQLVALLGNEGVYFTYAGWDSLSGQSEIKVLGFRVLLIVEGMINMIFFCGSIFLAILFFKTRDSFPRVFSVFFVIKLLCNVTDTLVSNAFLDVEVDKTAVQEMSRLFVFCIIWIWYMNKSSRVENTFVDEYNTEPVRSVVSTNEKIV